MSIATTTARTVTRSVATGKSRDRRPRVADLPAGALVLPVLRRSWCWSRSSSTPRSPGAPRFDMNLLTNYSSHRPPGDPGFRAGILGSLWLMLFTALMAVPLGIAAALYLEEFADSDHAVEPLHRGEPAEPRRRTRHRLRPAGRRGDGTDRLPGVRHRPRRCARPGAADPARHHHHDPRGGARGAAGDPPGLARPRRHRVADDVAPDPAVGRARHRDRHDPGPVARDRRGRAAGGRGARGLRPLRPRGRHEPHHRAARCRSTR